MIQLWSFNVSEFAMGPRQVYVPPLSKVNKIIIIALGCSFILQGIALKFLGFLPQQIFGLSQYWFFKGHLYQLLTYPLISGGILEVFFHGLLLWFMGSELEHIWREKRYLSYLGVAILSGGLCYLLLSLIFSQAAGLFFTGMGGVVNALMLAYAILFPNRMFSFMFIFPVKAKYLCWFIIAIEVYMGIFSPQGLASLAHLGSMVGGFLYLVFLTRRKQKKRRVAKTKLYLIKGEGEEINNDDSPKNWH
jgi:membrane associated rhomboid family serine protease